MWTSVSPCCAVCKPHLPPCSAPAPVPPKPKPKPKPKPAVVLPHAVNGKEGGEGLGLHTSSEAGETGAVGLHTFPVEGAGEELVEEEGEDGEVVEEVEEEGEVDEEWAEWEEGAVYDEEDEEGQWQEEEKEEKDCGPSARGRVVD